MALQAPDPSPFSMLPRWKKPWSEFVFSYGVQAVIVAIFVWVPILHPEVLEQPKRDYHAIELVPTPVPVNHEPRKQGTSGYTFRKLMTHGMNMMTGFSTMPLQIASLVGFIFTAFGFLVLAYVLFRYFLSGNPVPGFPFLASIVALFSGAQLFALGIIGEYLARMHFRSMQKPPYVVREAEPAVETKSSKAVSV